MRVLSVAICVAGRRDTVYAAFGIPGTREWLGMTRATHVLPSLGFRMDDELLDGRRAVSVLYGEVWAHLSDIRPMLPTVEELNPPVLAVVGLPPLDQIVGRRLSVAVSGGEVVFRIGAASVHHNPEPELLLDEWVDAPNQKAHSLKVRLPGRSYLHIPNRTGKYVTDTAFRLLP